ncbi:MAG: hypothetical protein KDE27_07990, partial [Planctomycetes bacterium]|nr:hypothetical protein [Planctomycetota bacterium]
MIFLDSSGFYALVSLIMQAAMAAILVAYFWIMPAQEAPWIQRLRIAFGAYTIALTAISVRFILVFQEASLASWLEEGQPLTVCLYGVYLAGKCVFLWYLVGGIASLRDRAWPAGPSWQLGLILLVAVAVVVANPAIEGILLFQSPLAAVAFFYAAGLLWPVRRGCVDVVRWLAAFVLLVGGLLWL